MRGVDMMPGCNAAKTYEIIAALGPGVHSQAMPAILPE